MLLFVHHDAVLSAAVVVADVVVADVGTSVRAQDHSYDGLAE